MQVIIICIFDTFSSETACSETCLAVLRAYDVASVDAFKRDDCPVVDAALHRHAKARCPLTLPRY